MHFEFIKANAANQLQHTRELLLYYLSSTRYERYCSYCWLWSSISRKLDNHYIHSTICQRHMSWYSLKRTDKYRGLLWIDTQIAKFMGPTRGPPGSCRPQMGPMAVPWTLLSGHMSRTWPTRKVSINYSVWMTTDKSWIVTKFLSPIRRLM